MTDLVVFVMIVVIVVVAGILVGMIVAGRIDRIMTPRPAPPGARTPDPGQADEEQHP